MIILGFEKLPKRICRSVLVAFGRAGSLGVVGSANFLATFSLELFFFFSFFFLFFSRFRSLLL
jgi:hypothetical protein